MHRFINISRYIYAALLVLPLGIVMFLFGIKNLLLTVDKLEKRTGIVKELNITAQKVTLKLSNSTFIYETSIPEHVKILSKDINKGDTITVYKIKGKSEYIERVDKKNKVLFEFEKVYFIPGIIMIIGLVILVSSIIYLIKELSDFWGGDKEKMNDFLDPWKKYKER